MPLFPEPPDPENGEEPAQTPAEIEARLHRGFNALRAVTIVVLALIIAAQLATGILVLAVQNDNHDSLVILQRATGPDAQEMQGLTLQMFAAQQDCDNRKVQEEAQNKLLDTVAKLAPLLAEAPRIDLTSNAESCRKLPTLQREFAAAQKKAAQADKEKQKK